MPIIAPSPRHLRLRRPFGVAVPALAALLLASCASMRAEEVDPVVTNAIAGATATDLPAAESYWQGRYTADPANRDNAYNYAEVLLRLDRLTQAIAVLQRATLAFPEDREIMAAYGKALARNGDFTNALTIIRRAQDPTLPDWTLLAAEAAILDQTGDHAQARILYGQAIQLAPNQASLYSNLGMSYVLTGQLDLAEQNLRRAAAMPTADSRVRQNLALVLGLQGRFEEAEAIARQELSPEQAEANMAYLRAMLGSNDAWTRLQQG
ncbi:MAG: tetratricopeptide repeat protein [Bauldia sp.]